MTDALARLRRVAEDLPPGASVSIPREWLLEAVAEQGTGAADLTVAQVAARYGRCESTIRSWISQHFLRAYKLRGRQLRIPHSAIAEFEEAERGGIRRAPRGEKGVSDLSAWRRATG